MEDKEIIKRFTDNYVSCRDFRDDTLVGQSPGYYVGCALLLTLNEILKGEENHEEN